MKTTSPMMNALLSSESTNAGISVVMLTSLLALAGFFSPDRPIISLSSSCAGVLQQEASQRDDAGVVGLR